MIFYFSATGNCSYIAEKLAGNINDNTTSIIDCVKNNTYEYSVNPDEKIGFIIPTYFYGIPMMVQQFLKHFELVNTKENLQAFFQK